jgi:hypothetical protein
MNRSKISGTKIFVILIVACTILIFVSSQKSSQWSWTSDNQAGPTPIRFGNTYVIIDDYCGVKESNYVLKTESSDPSLVEKDGQRYWSIQFTLSGPGVEYPNNTAYIQNKKIKFVIDEQGRRYDSKFEEIDKSSKDTADVSLSPTENANTLSLEDETTASPTPTPEASRVQRGEALMEHAFKLIDEADFAGAADDFDELSTLISSKKPDLRRQAASIADDLRRVAVTPSDSDVQQLLAAMRAFAVSLNAPVPSAQLTDSQSAQRKAIALYPDLAVAKSPLNTEFVSRYRRYKVQNPDYFIDPDWPTKLAKESAEALGQH